MDGRISSTNAREAETVFNVASNLPSAKRKAYLDRVCGTDAVLRRQVEQLLAAQENLGGFLPDTPRSADVVDFAERPGDLIGRYRLGKKLGEGGMGVVYQAEQTEPIQRTVALKIIKLGMDTRQVVARFNTERQALAMMDHPNIAKILDAGTVGYAKSEVSNLKSQITGGRPFFVMEYVPGEPITEFCQKNRLSTEDRLRLFIPVCQAVQSAHQKGIIHRDLKPSNVLVAQQGGNPLPKIIDFGVAKALNERLTAQTAFTNPATLIGTPAYMSPEQAELGGLDVDTRSDIYSLGVLLYELITGVTPFDGKELLAGGIDAMRQTIREQEPLRPSARLSQRYTASAQSPLGPRPSSFVADLDWIVMMCLEKDRSRRYETADALAADLERYLAHEPVSARPPSATYRFRKFVFRHRIGSFAAAVVATITLAGAAVSTWALVRERAAREREQAALAQAHHRLQAALTYVNEVLTNVAPEIRLVSGAAEAQESLLKAGLGFVQRLRESAGDDPAAKVALARMLLFMSERQNPGEPNTLGTYEAALARAEEALQLLRAESLPLTEADRLALIYQGEFAIIQALYGLARWDEGIRRSQAIESVLDQLERFPDRTSQVRRNRMLIRYNAGWATYVAGQPGAALTNHILPVLQSEWASQVTDNSDEAALHVLVIAHDLAANAYGLLKNFSDMLPHASESLRLSQLLERRLPENAFYANHSIQARAWLGYAMMRTGDPEGGLTALEAARQAAEAQVTTQGSSESFRRNRVIIVAIQALAYAGWSEAADSLAERRQRLPLAEARLAEAEDLAQTVKSKTGALPAARAEVAAARAALEALERAVPQPPQPAPIPPKP